MYCIYPPQVHKNQLTVGDLEYSILIDQDKGEKMFFKSILPKIGFILIYSLVIESGLEAGFPSLTEEIRDYYKIRYNPWKWETRH